MDLKHVGRLICDNGNATRGNEEPRAFVSSFSFIFYSSPLLVWPSV